jgi:hypothetical protein
MTDDRPLRILLVALHPGYVRNYEGPLRVLAERGHRIHIGPMSPSHTDRLADELADEFPGVTTSPANRPERGGWRNLRWTLRLMSDYARFLHPRYAESPALRDRVRHKLLHSRQSIGPLLATMVTLYVLLFGWVRNGWVSDRLVATLRWLDAAMPTSIRVDRIIEEFDPNVVLATPVVAVGRFEQDYIWSAKRLGVRSGVLVASWDNLTNKGLLRVVADRVVLWNEAQKREAIEMHGQPADHVVVTGSQKFDRWFEQTMTVDRQTFCDSIGLDPGKPFVLYLCSSPFIAPDEVSFVERFLATARAPGTALEDVGVLIRPHPQNATQWAEVDVAHHGNVAIFPRGGEQPFAGLAQATFYDSIYHSQAVVGINTSAQIEAGILEKTVHTVLDPMFAATQEGTLHFHHLLAENGGLLYESKTLDELVDNLGAAVNGEIDPGQTRRFINSFVRPHGLDVPAAPLVADAIEDLARMDPPAPDRRTWGQTIAYWLMAPVAKLSTPIELPRVSAMLVRLASNVRVLRRRLASDAADADVAVDVQAEERRTARAALKGVRKRPDAPIVAGPWLHDATSEVLYWLPFLRWMTQHNDISRSRLIAVSRGGVGSWYRTVADRYVEALDVVGFEDFRAAGCGDRLSASGWRSTTPIADRLIDHIEHESGIRPVVLGPALLREPMRRFQASRASYRHMEWFLERRKLSLPAAGRLEMALPERYVAAHFAFSPAFPDTPGNRRLVESVLERLHRRATIVLLGPVLGEDETPIDVLLSERILPLVEDMDPVRTLGAQTAAIAGAVGLVTTHGPLAHVAVAHGIDAVSLIGDPSLVNLQDVGAAERLALITGSQLSLVDSSQSALIAAMLSEAAVAQMWSSAADSARK